MVKMDHPKYIWQNGNVVLWDEAKTHVLTHSLHYGSAAFEGIRFYKTAQGPAIFRLDDHIKRLYYSAAQLKMTIPYSTEELRAVIINQVKMNELEAGYIRPIVYYGYGKMGVNPIGNPVDVVVACWMWGKYLHENVKVLTATFTRVHPSSTVVDAKLSGNYLNGVLGSLQLLNTHYQEVLFLDHDGNISEGAGENFFIVKDNVIYTPNLGSILPGFTRETVKNLCQQHKIKLVEKDISLEEAYHADEAFFTGTAAEVSSIGSIDDNVIGDGKAGKITTKIKTAYMDIVQGVNESMSHYLTYVK